MSKFLAMIRKARATETFPYGQQALAPNLKERAQAFAQKNPQPRAMYLLG